jgi:hypothetical protein
MSSLTFLKWLWRTFEMAEVFKGRIVPGSGGAAKSLRNGLKDQLVKLYPPIAPIHYGSINVDLDQPLVAAHEFNTSQIIWYPWWDEYRPRAESFGFIKIQFECPIGDQTYDKAWLWYPSGNPAIRPLHFGDCRRACPTRRTGNSLLHLSVSP